MPIAPTESIDQNWFRLPPVIVHPTPLDSEIAAVPWHVVKSRIGDARAKYEVDGRLVKLAIGDTGFDQVHCETGLLVGRVLKRFDFTGSGEYDGHGHGSHVAGDVISIAPLINLVSVKCLNDQGAGDDRWIGQSIRRAVDEGCCVFNGSFGASMPGEFSLAALEYANAHGCICVIAGGNTGRQNDVQWPARSPYCISVTPIDELDKLAPFGSTGTEIDTGWYGVRILSLARNGGHAVLSGSSMSAPLVAGLLALRIEWEIKNGGRRTNTVEDALAWLARICRDAGPVGRDDAFGYGIPDAMEAFGPPAVLPPSQPPTTDYGEISLFGYTLHWPAKPGDDLSIKAAAPKATADLTELLRTLADSASPVMPASEGSPAVDGEFKEDNSA